MEAMGEWFTFYIPENMGSVLNRSTAALRPLMDVEHDGSPPVALSMEGPRSKKLAGPGSDMFVTEIEITGFRTKGAPIPSDWPNCIAGWKDVWEPLGTVMLFRFAAIGSGTRVWASCAEHLSTVQRLFENFLKQIEAHYPAVGPLWQDYQTKCEMQLTERIEKYVKMESGAAGRAAVVAIEDEPVRRAGDAGAKVLPQQADGTRANATGTVADTVKTTGPNRDQCRKLLTLLQGRNDDMAHRGSTQPFTNAYTAEHIGLDDKTVRRWIPEYIRVNWTKRTLVVTFDEFAASWSDNRREEFREEFEKSFRTSARSSE